MRALVLLGLFAAPACTRPAPPCGPGETRLELRDDAGALTVRVAVAARAGELDLCDGNRHKTGALVRTGDALVLLDRGGAERLRVPDGQALEVKGPAGEAMRLFRRGDELRVLRPDGVAHGSILTREGAALVSDAGGSPVARVGPRDADAVVTAPGGSVRSYVVPSPGLPAAAVFAIEALSAEERVFLAAHLARGRLAP